TLGVTRATLIAPVPVVMATDVVPVTVAAPVVVMPPLPVASSAATVPDTDAPMEMLLPAPAPIFCSVKTPFDVIGFVMEIAVPPRLLEESVRLNPPVPALELRLPAPPVPVMA